VTLESSDLDREIDEYEIHGHLIHRAGYRAGVTGRPVSLSPHPRGDWRDDVWRQGWCQGHLDKLQRESLSDHGLSQAFN
jgi:ribosome modulation factor